MNVDNLKLVEKIGMLKKERNAIILAHYYTRPEVQDVADFVGDSYALSEVAATTPADVILFAGVKFMGETAKVLSPRKTVVIPVMEAGCSLADSCEAAGLAKLKQKFPDHKVVSYVNSSVGVKALTDVCCTSSNAVAVIESLKDEKIIFVPDRNLGAYLKKKSGREDIVLWDGACHVHDKFNAQELEKLKKQHPKAKTVAHPESREEVLALADFTGSTAAILTWCKQSPDQEFIVVTEPGILHKLQTDSPEKTFYTLGVDGGCNECEYMKMITLQSIADSLETLTPEVLIEEDMREKAEKSIKNMLAVK